MTLFKPINEKKIVEITKECTKIFTMEDHTILGGIGTIISDIYSKYQPKKVVKFGINDCFAEAGLTSELYKKYKIDADYIAGEIIKICS